MSIVKKKREVYSTTININRILWRKFKIRCLEIDIPLHEKIGQIIEEYLETTDGIKDFLDLSKVK